VNLEFVISSWTAYAPGISDADAWKAWAGAPWPTAGCDSPELHEAPAMLRRRLSPLGRMAFHVAHRCRRGDAGLPMVFASRYGDAQRSIELLGSVARSEPLSPTMFGLSVHNAIGATYAIAQSDSANHVAVAAGAGSAAAGVVEAVALLHDGAPEVMVVCYDAPLPGAYAMFADEVPASYAWAWRLQRPQAGQAHLSLSAAAAPALPAPPGHSLPFGLEAMRFVLSDDAQSQRAADGTQWTWRRCNA
jgi:hypothetical protein